MGDDKKREREKRKIKISRKEVVGKGEGGFLSHSW